MPLERHAQDQLVRVKHAVTEDPGSFPRNIASVAPGVEAHSIGQAGFRADVFAAPLSRLGLFTVRMRQAHIRRPPNPYAAITVPVGDPLEFFRGRQATLFFPQSAHILHTDDHLDLRIGSTSGMLVATFNEQWIDSISWRLTQNQHYYDLHRDWSLDLQTSTGQSFRHFLDFIWSETCRGGKFTRSELAIREIENTCTTLLILASEGESGLLESSQGSMRSKTPLDIAEEYLRENLTEPFALDKLIEVTGTSASTLLREFRKRHGMPPMRYLKLRRLEAARRELLSAEPAEATVTEVATTYGFYHLGRFSSYYRQTFGELPSDTLSTTH